MNAKRSRRREPKEAIAGGPYTDLSRRERQIMEILYRHGATSVERVRLLLPDAPGYSAVRALLRILEGKGHVRHEQQGPRYVYLPIVPAETAKESALRHLLSTFFDGSVEQVVAALLELRSSALPPHELERLSRLINDAKSKGD